MDLNDAGILETKHSYKRSSLTWHRLKDLVLPVLWQYM